VSGLRALRSGVAIALVYASHGLLDTMTDGGLGIAVWWPFSAERFFARWQPIPVVPLGTRMLSLVGARVLFLELLFFSPLLVWSLWPRRRKVRECLMPRF
jgi:inner membrane protein